MRIVSVGENGNDIIVTVAISKDSVKTALAMDTIIVENIMPEQIEQLVREA